MLSLVGGGGGVGWWWLTQGPGSLTSVPDVVGTTVAEATAQLVAAELVVSDTLLEEFDLVLPAGTVKGTSPIAGESLDKQSLVTLIVSLGPNPVSVPSAVGQTLEELGVTLEEQNLILGTTSLEFNDFVAKNSVLRLVDEAGQTLAPGSQVLAGSTVNAVTSAGAVPKVEGLTVDEARNLLQSVGLTGVVGGDGAYSSTIPEGSVVEIFGLSARVLIPGDTVTILVSRGPELVMIPDLIDDTIADAKKALEDLGFVVDVRSEYPESEWDRTFARVTSLSPSVGQEVPKGSTIILRSFV